MKQTNANEPLETTSRLAATTPANTPLLADHAGLPCSSSLVRLLRGGWRGIHRQLVNRSNLMNPMASNRLEYFEAAASLFFYSLPHRGPCKITNQCDAMQTSSDLVDAQLISRHRRLRTTPAYTPPHLAHDHLHHRDKASQHPPQPLL